MNNTSEKSKQRAKISLTVTAVLCVIMLGIHFFMFIQKMRGDHSALALGNAFGILTATAILNYTFIEYRTPHSNLLRGLFFLFGVYLGVFSLGIGFEKKHTAVYACLVLAALTVTYVAGRLNKIEKNRVLLGAVGVLILAAEIISLATTDFAQAAVGDIIASFDIPVFFAALVCSYIERYQQHISAGTEESEKEQ